MGYDAFDADAVRAVPGTLDYVYLPELDKAGHVGGPLRSNWRAALRSVEAHVARLTRSLPSDSLIVITADHGMVEVPDERRIDVDGPRFQAGIVRMAGEPRMRHLYTGEPEEVRSNWSELLGERGTVLLRAEAIGRGLFGDVDALLSDRIGDVIALAHENWAFTSQFVDPKPSGLRGLHGSLTSAELHVPCAVLRGGA